MSKDKEFLINKKQICRAFRVSMSAVAKWDIEPHSKKGRQVFYDLRDIIDFKFEQERKKVKPASSEKTELIKIQKETAEIQLKKLKDELFDRDEIVTAWSNLLINFKKKLQAIPVKLPQILSSLKNPNQIRARLEKYVNDSLRELSKFSIKDYERSSRSTRKRSK